MRNQNNSLSLTVCSGKITLIKQSSLLGVWKSQYVKEISHLLRSSKRMTIKQKSIFLTIEISFRLPIVNKANTIYMKVYR